MKTFALLVALCLATFLAIPEVTGETEPDMAPDLGEPELLDLENRQEIPLTLAAALQLALKNNLSIAIERVNPEISEQQIIQEESVFDPTASAILSKDRSVRQTSSALALPPRNQTENIDWDAGLSKGWVTGTETDLRFTNNRTDTNSSFAGLNPAYASDLVLSLTQPLLKDFGIGVNKTGIRIAANNKAISESQFRDSVMAVLLDTETAYWELVYALEALQVNRESLRLAEDFLKITERKVEVGILAPVEILQADTERAAREEGVITAEGALRDAEDRLRNLLNLSEDTRYWDVRLLPIDAPVLVDETSGLDQALSEAVEKRPDFQQARIDLENRNIQLKYSRNQALPRIDLVASLGVSGLAGDAQAVVQGTADPVFSPFDGNYSDTLEELKSKDNYNYTIGLQVEYPLGNRYAKSETVVAALEKQKALLALKDLENRIVREVREAHRRIETNRKRVAAAEVARRLAEERLRTETRRFELGLATSHDVLEYQEKLAVARSSELRARIDYRESLVHLEQVKGTLIETKGITL
ncbi:MAG: TolC family protein [bacterium]|nr:TolC family protein [bacterium]